MIHEAIILAGGFGTRLQSVVNQLPKPMAPVCGKPFLQYILDDLSQQGIKRCILAVGYLHETIIQYFGDHFKGMELVYSIESEPLGTGGGIHKACSLLQGAQAFVVNGDTFFEVNLEQLSDAHNARRGLLTLALKTMYQFDRYGTVDMNEAGLITGFQEKRWLEKGLINGGVYLLNTQIFEQGLPAVFSFEKEILEKSFKKGVIYGCEFDSYFIDIGIPEDYAKAQKDFAIKRPVIDQTWTLFLDRDGVINKKIDHDYVRNRDQFEFLPGVPEAIAGMSHLFGRICIVTNQRGIGRGLFNEESLHDIHAFLVKQVELAGGRIDGLFYCPHLENDPNCNCRKPLPGMAYQAKEKFPEINFSKAVMVGDAASDMQFASGLGMYTVLIGKPYSIRAEEVHASLADWAASLK